MHAFWLMVGNEYTIRTLSRASTEVCSFLLYKFINTKWKVKKNHWVEALNIVQICPVSRYLTNKITKKYNYQTGVDMNIQQKCKILLKNS